jgi:membrane-associated PAP2 superfamily phosphatase
MNPAPSTRWRSDLLRLSVCAAGLTLVFAVTPLDIDAARWFYRPHLLDHWPLASHSPWLQLYAASTWITVSLLGVGMLALAMAALRQQVLWRRYAIFVLLSVIIGPGLLINTVFKDHWDRPRPRDIVEFGGPLHYEVAPLRGEGGTSFPCGHCSVGFLYALGWWVWRRRHPRRATASLIAGISVGVALGLGRMAAGGHFLSDVLWAALIAYAIAQLLYYYVLRIPEEESRAAGVAPAPVSRSWQIGISVLAAIGGLLALLALLAAPNGRRIATEIRFASLPQAPEVFEVQAGTADVDITLVDQPGSSVSVAGELHGFGLPTSELSVRSAFVWAPMPTLRYQIVQRGWFTDLNSSLSFRVPADRLHRLVVTLGRGNIRVTDLTQAHLAGGRLQLDLRTASGIVQRR